MSSTYKKPSPYLVSFVVLSIAFVMEVANAHQIIGIHDGDTMTVLVDRNPVKIRLANIDAPELRQAYGRRSKESLSSICWGKDAAFEPQTTDRYGRTVAVVWCDGVEANRRQVASGMAWVYQRYNKDASLPVLEQAVRLNRIGLWHEEEPVPPWKYRKAKRHSASKPYVLGETD